MARIAGIDLPRKKRIEIALTYIYGIGLTSAKKILSIAGVNPDIKVNDLTDEDTDKLRKVIEADYKTEGTLKLLVKEDIKRLKEINCYRGIRHKKGLPVRGQRTRTNARTRKGPSKGSVALKKKAEK